ncbi:MAG: hypothetical protein AABY10_00820 [Nanoarchaeota archaeon]
MQTKFKRHEKVRLLADPNPEFIEYYSEKEEPIRKGMLGEINVILPNGEYHIKIVDKEGNTIAYVEMSEEYLEEM